MWSTTFTIIRLVLLTLSCIGARFLMGFVLVKFDLYHEDD